MLLHPKVAALSCGDCQRHLVDDSWEITRRPARVGLPVLRPAGVPTPCAKCPKIPTGERPSPRSAVELSEQNQRAYWHWLQASAVGWLPHEQADPVVRRNAALIQSVVRAVEREREQARTQQMLVGVLGVFARPGGHHG